jgi:hypothetical protein
LEELLKMTEATEAQNQKAQGLTADEVVKLPVTTVITIEGPMFGPEVKVTITSKDEKGEAVDDVNTFKNYLEALQGVGDFASSTADLLALAIIKKLLGGSLK